MNKEDLNKYIADLQFKKDIPEMRSGYTVTVSERIIDGKRSRIQKFQGLIISNHHKRRITHNILLRKKIDDFWVEKRFFCHSPLIEDIEVNSVGHARRANLFYLREKKGLSEKLKRLKK